MTLCGGPSHGWLRSHIAVTPPMLCQPGDVGLIQGAFLASCSKCDSAFLIATTFVNGGGIR